MSWFKYHFFTNEENEAMEVQWLSKVRAGEWWECDIGHLVTSPCFFPDKERLLGTRFICSMKRMIILYLSLSSSCVSVYTGSLFFCLFLSCLSPSTCLPSSISLFLCLKLDLSSYQVKMSRKALLPGGLTYNMLLWQRLQERHCNETLVHYSGALRWPHTPMPHRRQNSH